MIRGITEGPRNKSRGAIPLRAGELRELWKGDQFESSRAVGKGLCDRGKPVSTGREQEGRGCSGNQAAGQRSCLSSELNEAHM